MRRQVLRADFAFEVIDDPLGFFFAAVDHEPAWTFRDPLAEKHHEQTEYGADPKGETPA